MDPLIESMPITAPFVESQENVGNLVNMGEQRVDEATDMEGVEMSDGEAAAEGQKVTHRRPTVIYNVRENRKR